MSCSGVQGACCCWPTPHVEHLWHCESRNGEQALTKYPDGQERVEQGLHLHAVQSPSTPHSSAAALYVPALHGGHS